VTGPLVSISGQVKRPAIYEMLGGEKVSDLIVLAGGTNAEAFMEKISIDRVGQDDNRVISDIDLSERLRQSDSTAFARADLALRDGDRVDVPSIFDLRENTVRIMGNVKHPGVFGLRDSMRVSDLIDHGQQIRDNSYLERANLFRIYPDLRREVYTVNIAEILAGVSSSDFLLMDRDSLVVYAQHDIKRNMTVTVFGAVKHPGMYSFYANMHLSDLVFLAGNPLKQTYLLQAEIARTRPGKPAEIIHANLEEALAARGTPSDVTLCEDDRIFIFTVPRYREDNTVSVEGEVMFPGTYALMMENERLSDVLARCGGFTPDAFKEGLVFMRGSITDDIEKRHVRSILASTEVTVLDSLNRPLPKLGQTVDVSAADRIIIDIDRALKDYDSPDNILLRRGDRIFVPAAPAGVQVLGAVAMNGTVIYKKNKLANYFIKSSGGFSRNADKGQTRLAKPDGRVFSGYRAFQTAIEPGDIIIVPQKVERHKSWLRLGTSAAAIASSLLTGMLIADRLR
jgi:protein involved in polysaccharide export with SLBB domain